jgi:two-component system OmpR family response regulator
MLAKKCRVLCVDDHEDTGVMLKYLLGNSDYEVKTADNIEEALRLAKNEGFDLYVLDKRLPDGTGIELCRDLRQLAPDVPIIFYSGDAYELHKLEGLSAGADLYVSKPEIDQLLSAVNQLLTNARCAAALS